jgi:hypothetical protein
MHRLLKLPVEMKEIFFVYSASVLGDHYGRTWAVSVMPFVYTGTMESYLCAGATAVVLSDAIFDKSAMTNHDYTEILKRSAVATALASSIRRRLWENFPGRLNFLSCRKWWINLCKQSSLKTLDANVHKVTYQCPLHTPMRRIKGNSTQCTLCLCTSVRTLLESIFHLLTMLWSIRVSISEDRHLLLMVIYEKVLSSVLKSVLHICRTRETAQMRL